MTGYLHGGGDEGNTLGYVTTCLWVIWDILIMPAFCSLGLYETLDIIGFGAGVFHHAAIFPATLHL